MWVEGWKLRMLKHTFIHIDGIGETKEQNLWKNNILTHQDAIQTKHFPSHQLNKIIETKQKLEERDALYLHTNIPSKERWRMFGEFHDSVAYIDIETTGLYGFDDIITTIALYDGKSIKHYVYGQNLNDFKNDIKTYKLLVTYNGTNFDLPFIRNFLGISIDYAHIDLRYILASLGYSGGLKGCEKKLGLSRNNILENIDGSFAVWLWKYYIKNKDDKALHTLLSYNIEDVLSLEKLMIISYNEKVYNLPIIIETFKNRKQPHNHFSPNNHIIEKIKSGIETYGNTYLTNNQEVQSHKLSTRKKSLQATRNNIYSIPHTRYIKDDKDTEEIPSKAKTLWIYITTNSKHYPETIKGKGGKWLIFIPEVQIDETWKKIQKYMLSNRLVRYAKCSTAMKNRIENNGKTDCVVCIYTFDCANHIDVGIVRKKLRKIGFEKKLCYKADIDTLSKNYHDSGNKKPCLYKE